MAHQIINNRAVVDWTTGDPEGDRINLLAAYRDFINEVYANIREGRMDSGDNILYVFQKWNVDTGNQIDEVPRIWIKRPE